MELKYGQLQNIFERIQELLKYVEEKGILDKRYRLYLANGEQINYQLTKEAIPHLLGINISYLSSLNIFRSTNSYELLLKLLENDYKINKLYAEGKIQYNQLFSKYIYTKLDNFEQNMLIDINDISFVIKYDSQRSYFTGEDSKKYNYIIVKKDFNNTVRLLCLGKMNEKQYAAMSNQAYNTEQEINEVFNTLLKNQEITYVNSINYIGKYDFEPRKFYINLDKKAKIMNFLRNIKRNYDVSIDVNNEFSWLLNGVCESKSRDFKDSELIKDIIEKIKNGEIIEERTNDEFLNQLIYAFNDFIFSGANCVNENATSLYTEQTQELTKLRQEITELKEIKTILETSNKTLNSENTELKKENEDFKDKQQKIFELVKPRTK